MKLHYISPSLIPSLAANSVHVMMQCAALANEGVDVILYAKRTIPDENDFHENICYFYGVKPHTFSMNTFYSPFTKADNLRIAIKALYSIECSSRPEVVLSRNLYAAFWLSVIRRNPLMFETHQLEIGLRKVMQRMVMTRPWVKTIVISQMLKDILSEYHKVSPAETIVLHDAATTNFVRHSQTECRNKLVEMFPIVDASWKGICGYFGHLYAGRGLEIIELLAQYNKKILFLIFGGVDSDIRHRRWINKDRKNIIFAGHVPHPVAQVMMRSVDVLLMPYQEKVSIGVTGHDTARWMSPMKMFEYMSSGLPIISSDLPVLREVLKDGENALLVPAGEVEAWSNALKRILTDTVFAKKLGDAAYNDYSANHTWQRRAREILRVARTL